SVAHLQIRLLSEAKLRQQARKKISEWIGEPTYDTRFALFLPTWLLAPFTLLLFAKKAKM
ncbi:MAG TPA: hypothetical protein VFN23_03075, partial [Ktedonobacteraceae bacterium]|nr:hypothetical protein [Ktedonobacteraceae bacterium]